MNTKSSVSLILLCFSLSMLNAQTTPIAATSTTVPFETSKPKGYNKGHFVFGTNLFNYTNSTYTETNYSNSMPSDTVKNTFSNFSFSLNIWAGYFVSDKVCVGLNFNDTYGNSGPASYPYYVYSYYGNYGIFSALIPTDIFFRYYIIGDTGLVNVFVEGIVGGSYSSGTYVLNDKNYNSQNQTETLPITETTLNSNINVALSLNASKHFAFQFKAGFVFNTEDYNFAAGTISGGGTTTPVQASETTFTSVSFVGTLGLQYKL